MATFRRILFSFVGLALIVALCFHRSSPAEEPKQPAEPAPPKLAEQFRKPIALAWVEPSKLVAVANGRSGTISLVDIATRRVESETKIAERLSNFAAPVEMEIERDEPRRFAALDDKTHEILHLGIERSGIEIIGRLRVSDDPRRVLIAADRRTAVVTCRWSRRVDVVDLHAEAGSRDPANWNRAFPRLLRSIELPFAPQECTIIPWPDGNGDRDDASSHVVVADAFGGRLAVVDFSRGTIVAQHELDGRNIRGLSRDCEHDALLVAYQRADGRQPTTADNLKSGKPVANLVARIPLALLAEPRQPGSRLDLPEHLMRLDVAAEGDAPLGAADPDDVYQLSEGPTVVVLSGTNQLATFARGMTKVYRFDVGARPVAVLLDPLVRRMVVANSLDDTLSILEQEPATISLGPRPELWPRDRGERLFFDGRRSLGGFMSCHSCHTDGHAAGGLADTLGDGTYGTPKRIPTLLASSITDPWGWNGALRELRDQVDQSMRTSMHDPHYRTGDADDLTAYLHTLPFPPPLVPKPRDEADERLVAVGRAIFERERCAECHVGPLTFTSPAVYDIGLRDERGLAKFNPPSLRGVGHGIAFFHDARAKSLEELFRKERHQLGKDLSAEELRSLVRYLQGL